jgi:hypothetical protein
VAVGCGGDPLYLNKVESTGAMIHATALAGISACRSMESKMIFAAYEAGDESMDISKLPSWAMEPIEMPSLDYAHGDIVRRMEALVDPSEEFAEIHAKLVELYDSWERIYSFHENPTGAVDRVRSHMQKLEKRFFETKTAFDQALTANAQT